MYRIAGQTSCRVLHTTRHADGERTGGIQVIARAAAILRTLRDSGEGLSLGQIAERVNLPRSTVQRIVGSLQDEEFVAPSPDKRGVGIGPGLRGLAENTHFNVVEKCRETLTELSQRTGETVDLAVCRDGGMVFLDQLSGQHRLRAVSSVGDIFPLMTTANGRAALANMGDDRLLRFARMEWRASGRKEDAVALLAMISKIRSTGLAYDRDEHTPGISAIGFAFRDPGDDIYAISVPIPSSRYEASRAAVEQALLQARADVNAIMEC